MKSVGSVQAKVLCVNSGQQESVSGRTNTLIVQQLANELVAGLKNVLDFL
eukprot:SAG22_NODE_2290_length_2752_cov_2.249152_3_plen_50_part_00